MGSFRVVGPVAVVKIGTVDQYIYKGSTVPDGADEASVRHLLSVGLLSPETEDEPEVKTEDEPEVKTEDEPEVKTRGRRR